MLFNRFFGAFVLLTLIASLSLAQGKGTLTGKITDRETNEELIGASIVIVNTKMGSQSDIDGRYEIKNLPAGTYSVKASYISYQTVTVENVVITDGKITTLDISLTTQATQMQEVVITAEALKNSEAAVLKIQKNSINIVDGMSAELIKKNNSSSGTDILKSMTGVTISDGKYAYIRGIGDRYNNTMLNGANLPSTDPEKKSFSYDIFPASLIENVLTAKTFTPDKPADFSGGLVQIQTLEFPQGFFMDFSAANGYNEMNNRKDFYSYEGGSKDYLGYDDGSRAIPSVITETSVTKGNFSDSSLQFFGKSFKNNWNTKKERSALNGSYKFSIGHRLSFSETDILGLVGSLSYSSGFDTKDVRRRTYEFGGEKYDFTGNVNTFNVTWGALLNVSYKFLGTNKISLKNIYNQDGEDETAVYKGIDYGISQYRERTSLRFVSRSLLSTQLLGEHQFDLINGVNLQWNTSYAISKRDEPDVRRYIYSKDALDEESVLRFQLDPSLANRFYGDLDDKIYGMNADITIKAWDNQPYIPNIKVGFLLDKKERNFDARTFGFRNVVGGNFFREDSILMGSVENIFVPENFENKFIEIQEITKKADSYYSRQSIFSSYLMFDFSILPNLKLITGLRWENSRQNLESFTITNEAVNISNVYDDYSPSFNLTYLYDDLTNIRFAYSKTLARPEFRELAPYSYFDFLSFELVEGNPSLKRTLVDNFDLRLEVFPGAGELLAVSLFYKSFRNPIEQILKPSSNSEAIRSFDNGKKANNYGFELEVRKNFSFINEDLRALSFVGNLSLIDSKIELNQTTNTSGTSFQEKERPLQGQADYIFNLGLYYDQYENGTSASIVYNKTGHRISRVGVAGLGNVIIKPRDQVDISVSQKIYSSIGLKLTLRDIFAQDYIQYQQTPTGDKETESYKTAATFSLSLSYSF